MAMAKAVPIADARKYFELLRDSGLLSPDKLATVEAGLEKTPDATALARSLLQQSLITKWQALQLLNGFNQLMVGKYKLLEQTSASEIARTYLAEHVPMNKKVSLQILSRRLSSKPPIVQKFLSDAQTTARLDHRNLLHVFDVASDGDRHYVVTEQVAGQPLSALGEKAASLPISRAVSYLWQACEGLGFAHEAGIPHGDVKPANLLVDGEGTLKILNLGAASISSPQADNSTESGEVALADQHEYMAPERLAGQPASIESDMYSLGCVFGYLLTGTAPAAAAAREKDKAAAITAAEVQQARADCPEVLAATVAKMTSVDPTQRPATFAEVVQTLKAWAQTTKTKGDKKTSSKASKDSGEVVVSGKTNGNGAAVKARRPVVAKALAPTTPAATVEADAPASNDSTEGIRINIGEAPAATEVPSFSIDVTPKKSAAKPAKASAPEAEASQEKSEEKAASAAPAEQAPAEGQAAPAKKGGKRKGVPVWMIAASIGGFALLLAGGAFAVYLGMSGGSKPVEVAQRTDGAGTDTATSTPTETDAAPDEGNPPMAEGNPPTTEDNPPAEGNPPVESNPAPAPVAAVPAATAATDAAATPGTPAAAKPETPAAPAGSSPPSSEPAKPTDPASPEPKPGPTPDPEKKAEPDKKTEPEKKAEPPKPAETKKATETKKAAPSKPADPFPGVGARVTVDIPALPAKTEGAEPPPAFKLIPCTVKPDAILTMNLKGAESVLRGKQKFSLTEADQGRARQAWECKLEGAEGDPVIATLKIEENELRFSWTAAALEQPISNTLRNCLLVFSAPGRDKPVEIFLRSPLQVEAFVIDPSKPRASFKANLDSPPLEDRYLSLQFGKVEGAPASAFRPSDRLELAREAAKPRGKGKDAGGESREPFVWLGAKAAEDQLVLGFKLDPNVSASNFQMGATPYFRVEESPAPIKLVKAQLPKLLAAAEGRLVGANNNDKLASKAGNLPKDRQEQLKNLAKANIELASKYRDQVSAVSTLLESMGEGVKIHFTLVFNADGVDVPLVIAGDPPAPKK